MGLVVQDGFPGQGAVTNLLGVDSDQHATLAPHPAAFGRAGIYRAALTSPTIVAPSAGSALFVLGPSLPTSPPRLVIVNSVKAACTVTGTITTAVQMDLGLYIIRGGGLIPTAGGGTQFAPTPASQQQMRTSMGGSVSTIAICGNASNLSGTVDTNPLARVFGFSGTAIGTQFFTPTVATLFYHDHTDNHPIILANTGGNVCDKLLIQNVQAGPATGTFTITVIVEWEELVAY